MALLSNTAVLLGKELRTEFRSRELLTTTNVFVLIVIVLFSFTFDPTSAESRRFGAGLLWLAFLFAASLMLQPCFLREQTSDTLSALRLSVSDPFAIFLAKLVANTLFLLLTELLLLPVFAVMYNVPVLPMLHWLILVFFLGSLGVSISGTAPSPFSPQPRMRNKGWSTGYCTCPWRAHGRALRHSLSASSRTCYTYSAASHDGTGWVFRPVKLAWCSLPWCS